MLRLAIPLLALLTYGLAGDVSECRWGESYWCSSLENADTCGAFSHCMSTVWKNQVLKVDDSEYCSFCKRIIQDVADFIKDNRTENDILRFVKNACKMIPQSGLAEECSRLAETFLTKIIEMIANDVKPGSVCGLIRLCAGFEDTVVHAKLPTTPAVMQSLLIRKAAPSLNVQKEPICTDCKKFFTDIQNIITDSATEKEIETLVDQFVCTYLGAYADECRNVVKTYLPEILILIKSEFDPNLLCQYLGVCAATEKGAKTFLIDLRLKNSEFYQKMSAENSEDGCTVCTTIMKDIQDLDRSTAVQNELKNFLKTQICSRLANHKLSCDLFIDLYAETVFQLLANELDPESRCRSLGFCAAKNQVRDVTRESTPAKLSEPQGQRVSVSPQCMLCEYIMEKIDGMLKENATKEEIIAALDKVCSILPSSLRADCDDFVKQYGSIVIDLLVQELDPQLVCTTIGLCSGKSRVMPPKLNESTKCIVCETLIQYLEALLQENATVTEIEQLLDKICNFLPQKYQQECDYIVSKYSEFIIQYLSTAMTPKAICQLIGLCDTKLVRPVEMAELTEAKVVKKSHPLLGEIECTWGPKFWCSSRENAITCKAVEYCEQTGWNF